MRVRQADELEGAPVSVYPEGAEIGKHAWVSGDGVYRYSLIRRWGEGESLAFVLLNPSIADHAIDDPTIRRCVGFARSLGYDGLRVVNLYAFRATKPANLWLAEDPVGPRNDEVLRECFTTAAQTGIPVVAGWGANAKADRIDAVMAIPDAAQVLHAFGLTKAGAPRHPLYLPSASTLTRLA